ncbi:MAG: DUF1800 family protein [Akkermansiaceae bacterium]
MYQRIDNSDWSYEKAAHLLSRASMRANRDDRIALFELGRDQGVEAAVDSLVDPVDDWNRFPFPDWWDSKETAGGPSGSVLGSEDDFVQWYAQQLCQANPLGAKMFKFFVDHAPVDGRPLLQQNRYIYLFQHFDLCRRNALGNFRAFIEELTWDGAMMWMLDMKNSVRGAINENFGRELLELFTLGVSGGYTEEDVVACSRAFTGRFTPAKQPDDWPYAPYLNQTQWPPVPHLDHYYLYIDTDEMEILGQSISGFTPDDEGETRTNHGPEVLDIIFQQPASGEYLVWKLWRYFVSPDPPEELVKILGERFRTEYGFELRPLLKDLFLAEDFYKQENLGNQIKDAGDFFVSCTHALDVALPNPRLTFLSLEAMGYQVMAPPNIAGWPEPIGEGNGWLGAEKVLFRVNLPPLWLEPTMTMFDRTGGGSGRSLYEVSPPDDFDLRKIVPSHLRGRRNLDLLLDELNDRFLPFHRFSGEQRDFLIGHYERNFRELEEETVIREMIRLVMALPEFQLQ